MVADPDLGLKDECNAALKFVTSSRLRWVEGEPKYGYRYGLTFHIHKEVLESATGSILTLKDF